MHSEIAKGSWIMPDLWDASQNRRKTQILNILTKPMNLLTWGDDFVALCFAQDPCFIVHAENDSRDKYAYFSELIQFALASPVVILGGITAFFKRA